MSRLYLRPSQKKQKGTGVMSMLEPLKAAYALIDAQFEKGVKEKELQLPCKKGCSSCCYQLVMTTIPEAMVVISHVMTNYHAAGQFVPQYNERGTRQVQQALELMAESSQEVRATKWWNLQHPCICLTKDGTCATYEARPPACRAYAVISEPEKCKEKDSKVLCCDVIPFEAMAFEVSNKVATEMRITNVLMPFPMALKWAVLAFDTSLGELRKQWAQIYGHSSKE